MGTEVLRPQDCLLRHSPSLRCTRQLRQRREGSPKQPPAKPRLVMGQVTILRRGKSLPPEQPKRVDPAVFAAERLGRDSASIPKQIRLKPPSGEARDEYAGSAFDLSPSPRAVPLPSFSRTKQAPVAADSSAAKEGAEAIASAGMKISEQRE